MVKRSELDTHISIAGAGAYGSFYVTNDLSGLDPWAKGVVSTRACSWWWFTY